MKILIKIVCYNVNIDDFKIELDDILHVYSKLFEIEIKLKSSRKNKRNVFILNKIKTLFMGVEEHSVLTLSTPGF